MTTEPTTSPDKDGEPRRRDHRDVARILAERRALLGAPPVARNEGSRRTASKRALLDAIGALGGKW